ncbi:hypothetical protein [Halodesulfovibrio spirochaetisodalis]|nr:hypothetical protein [Halodesulfovibrio spirochaetisodalis]
MQEIYAMPPVRTVSLFERVSPQVAAVAGVLLVLITIPCIQTAQNALTLLDTQLVDAALDSAQFFL